jgi:hypothetical protein
VKPRTHKKRALQNASLRTRMCTVLQPSRRLPNLCVPWASSISRYPAVIACSRNDKIELRAIRGEIALFCPRSRRRLPAALNQVRGLVIKVADDLDREGRGKENPGTNARLMLKGERGGYYRTEDETGTR